jgi:hypothetical protein
MEVPMCLSRLVISRLPIVGVLAVAVGALLLAAGPAPAQQFNSPPPNGNTKLWPYNVGYTGPREPALRLATLTPPALARRAPASLPPHWDGALLVTVTRPAPAQTPAPLVVNLRGPNGEVRSFPVAGGPEAIRRQEVIVRPGESATLNVMGTARAR